MSAAGLYEAAVATGGEYAGREKPPQPRHLQRLHWSEGEAVGIDQLLQLRPADNAHVAQVALVLRQLELLQQSPQRRPVCLVSATVHDRRLRARGGDGSDGASPRDIAGNWITANQ